MENKYVCEDCGYNITDENIGAKYPPKNGVDRYKCSRCFEKEPELTQHCLVYSRVVGYLAPVNQWNKGKVSEYERRKVFLPKYKKKK